MVWNPKVPVSLEEKPQSNRKETLESNETLEDESKGGGGKRSHNNQAQQVQGKYKSRSGQSNQQGQHRRDGGPYYQPDDKCPLHIHGGHNWGTCRYNPHNKRSFQILSAKLFAKTHTGREFDWYRNFLDCRRIRWQNIKNDNDHIQNGNKQDRTTNDRNINDQELKETLESNETIEDESKGGGGKLPSHNNQTEEVQGEYNNRSGLGNQQERDQRHGVVSCHQPDDKCPLHIHGSHK